MGALAGRRSHFVLAAVMSLLFGCSTMRKLVLDAALVANVILTSISRRLFSDRFARSTGIAAASATERLAPRQCPTAGVAGGHIEVSLSFTPSWRLVRRRNEE